MEISTSTTEYVPLRSVLRGSICHFPKQSIGATARGSTAPFVWFREFELDYGYLVTPYLSQKISGREVVGVWKLARLVDR